MDHAQQIVYFCQKSEIQFAFAESCTGGKLAAAIVDVPGASEVFQGSLVTYTDSMKMNVLGVDGYLLGKLTAVSVNIAEQMSLGVFDVLQTQPTDRVFTVATTGFVGPFTTEPRHAYVAITDAAAGLAVEVVTGMHEVLFEVNDRGRNQQAVVDRALLEILNMLEKYD